MIVIVVQTIATEVFANRDFHVPQVVGLVTSTVIAALTIVQTTPAVMMVVVVLAKVLVISTVTAVQEIVLMGNVGFHVIKMEQLVLMIWNAAQVTVTLESVEKQDLAVSKLMGAGDCTLSFL